jgi:hypothetical protein
MQIARIELLMVGERDDQATVAAIRKQPHRMQESLVGASLETRGSEIPIAINLFRSSALVINPMNTLKIEGMLTNRHDIYSVTPKLKAFGFRDDRNQKLL